MNKDNNIDPEIWADAAYADARNEMRNKILNYGIKLLKLPTLYKRVKIKKLTEREIVRLEGRN